jgi:simple sugar transport system ATP-binding protein
MRNITKTFPGVAANSNISITLEEGEIHALLGENGAGKTTLMGVLFGLHRPDSGSVYIRGEKRRIAGPPDAAALGIGMVHQHFKLVPAFTVTENIMLGTKRFLLNTKKAAADIAALSARHGLGVDPHAKIEAVSVGMQQRVEILKMLHRNADILIFDEPTAVLTPQETAELMKIMRSLISQGKSIIFITHKLHEIKAVADRCTVLRAGKVSGTVNVADTSAEQMAEMMVGRKVSLNVVKPPPREGQPVFAAQNITVWGARRETAVRQASFEVREGEILGLAGVDGNGQSELAEALAGLRKIHSGSLTLRGKDITRASVKKRMRQGLAHIPEDRGKRGLILDFSLADNLALALYDRPPFSRHGLRDFNQINLYAQKIISDFDVRAASGGQTSARAMSGGNRQKAVVGREMERKPAVLIAVQPTRGLDVGSIEYIHKRLLALREDGCAILLVSLDLDEILELSDRVAVISRGRIAGVLGAAEADKNTVGLMMAGAGKGAEVT